MYPSTRKFLSMRGENRQRGVALIVALVFLLIMTLLGATAMQTTSQQETMAGNTRQRNLAFQATEAALREGERWLDASIANREAAMDHNALTVQVWNGSAPAPTGMWARPPNSELAADPGYYVEPPVFRRYPGDMDASQPRCQRIYPVNSRGVGAVDHAIVVLRSTYDPLLSGLVDCPNP